MLSKNSGGENARASATSTASSTSSPIHESMVLDQSTILSMNSFNFISSKILPAPLAGFCVCILEFRGGGPLFRRVRKYPSLFLKKLVSTIFIFFFAWYTMHFAGGAVATMRFERMTQNMTVEPLPDGK